MSDPTFPHHMDVPYKITLYKNGNNKNIYYYFTWKKKSYRGSTATSNFDESQKNATKIYYEISGGIREKGRIKITKFDDVVKQFLKYKKDHVSPRTIKDYQQGSKFLLEKYKGKDVQTLCNKSEYESYTIWRRQYYETHTNMRIRHFKRNGKLVKSQEYDHVGNVVINREISLLRSVLRYGKEYMNLFKEIDIPSYKMLKEKRREELLSKEEYLRLKDYWMKKNPFYGHMISFLANTGLRYPSEIYKLQWKDVNLRGGYVEIRNRKSRHNTLTSSVPIVGSARKTILWLKSREGIEKGQEDYVFVDDKGRRIKNIVGSFKKSLNDCGMDKKITMYSFRHLFTTKMVQRPDIPLPVLSSVLGHTNTVTLQKHYLHLNPRDIVRSFRRSEERMNKLKKTQNKGNPPNKPLTNKVTPLSVFFE